MMYNYPSYNGSYYASCPTGPSWPYGACNCSGNECWSTNPNEPYDPDKPKWPCNQDGNTDACMCIAGDAPWLQPKPIGCGRTHVCKLPWCFYLHLDDLDHGALPGRPPHTIVCVRSKGTSKAKVLTTNPESYELSVCITIPVEIVIRDCCGYCYCLRSSYSQEVSIQLATKVCNIKNSFLYVKTRVRLCRHIEVPAGPSGPNPLDKCDPLDWCEGKDPTKPIAPNDGCRDGDRDEGDDELEEDHLGKHLPTVCLDSTVEACVMKLVPYGIGDPKPYDDTFPFCYAACGKSC